MSTSKFRQFSIVFHNVKDDCKSAVETFFQDSQKLVVALEPYPEQYGYHIHVFVQFKNPRGFKSVLNSCEQFKSAIVTEKPPTETRDWGRVQVDQMRGSFEQATAYLTAPKKSKPLDPNVTVSKKFLTDYTPDEFFKHYNLWVAYCIKHPNDEKAAAYVYSMRKLYDSNILKDMPHDI